MKVIGGQLKVSEIDKILLDKKIQKDIEHLEKSTGLTWRKCDEEKKYISVEKIAIEKGEEEYITKKISEMMGLKWENGLNLKLIPTDGEVTDEEF